MTYAFVTFKGWMRFYVEMISIRRFRLRDWFQGYLLCGNTCIIERWMAAGIIYRVEINTFDPNKCRKKTFDRFSYCTQTLLIGIAALSILTALSLKYVQSLHFMAMIRYQGYVLFLSQPSVESVSSNYHTYSYKTKPHPSHIYASPLHPNTASRSSLNSVTLS